MWYSVKVLKRDSAVMDRINLSRDLFDNLWVDDRCESLVWPKKVPMKYLDLLAEYREEIDSVSWMWKWKPIHNTESSHTWDSTWYMFRAYIWLISNFNDDDFDEDVYEADIDDFF